MSEKSNGKTAQRPNKIILSRTLFVMIVCGIVAFIVLGVNLYNIQIRDHDLYEMKAVDQQTRESVVTASRGSITDRNGNVLAVSATAYTVFISPHDIEYYEEDANAIADGLSRILGVDRESIIEKSKDTASYYKTISRKIEAPLADEVRAFISDGKYKSIHIENDTKRYYPYGSLACHVVGFVGMENSGLEGLEAEYNGYLTGTDGSVVRLTSNNGTDMLFDSYENYYDAVDGSDLALTVDVNIQAIAEKYLKQAIIDNRAQNGGCVIVQDVNNGAILGMASLENYDLNNYLAISEENQAIIDAIENEEERSQALYEAQLKQWRNKSVSDTYEPGSVFKIITMAIGLEEGVVSENDSFFCGGSIDVLGREPDNPVKCWKTIGHGGQSLRESAMHSCNVAFVDIGLRIGAGLFYDYVEAFGLKERTGLDVPSGAEANSQWWSEEVFEDPYNYAQLAAASFGQTFNVTPVQMITAISAVANGGYLLEPYIVHEITDPDGEVVYSKDRTVVRQVISNETSKKVCDILESVVGDEGGTGGNAYVPGYRVAGKTGTTTKTTVQAATGVKEYMVSFCGFAPADDPEVAVLLILDNPVDDGAIYVSGGVMAAPSVGKILSEVLPYLGVEPQYTEEEAKRIDITVPKFEGLSAVEANDKAATEGVVVRMVGTGSMVTGQLPAANAEVAAGTEIVLFTDGTVVEGETTVPNLSGMTLSSAIDALKARGLYMNTSGASPANSGVTVMSQSVSAGEAVEKGTIIEVFLTDSNNIGQY